MYDRFQVRERFKEYERRYAWWCILGLLVHIIVTAVGHPVIGLFFLSAGVALSSFSFAKMCVRFGVTKLFFVLFIFREGNPALFWLSIAQAYALGTIIILAPIVVAMDHLGLLERFM